VVKVAGFHNSTPKLKFVCRRNLMLSINIDKNSEQDLQLAVDSAAKILAAEKLEVVDYSSHAEVSRDPGHYVVFWELNADGNDDVLQSCCDELDRAFTDPGYVGSRKTSGIGPLELRVLQRGTFQKVLRHYLSLGAPVSQFKSPRCVGRSNNSGILQRRHAHRWALPLHWRDRSGSLQTCSCAGCMFMASWQQIHQVLVVMNHCGAIGTLRA
jgi:auxin responsive GH3 family protein/jasmonic acid-amino synthetase